MGARVVDGEVAIGHATDRFDSLGPLKDPNLEEQVREVVRQRLLVEAGARRGTIWPPEAVEPCLIRPRACRQSPVAGARLEEGNDRDLRLPPRGLARRLSDGVG